MDYGASALTESWLQSAITNFLTMSENLPVKIMGLGLAVALLVLIVQSLAGVAQDVQKSNLGKPKGLAAFGQSRSAQGPGKLLEGGHLRGEGAVFGYTGKDGSYHVTGKNDDTDGVDGLGGTPAENEFYMKISDRRHGQRVVSPSGTGYQNDSLKNRIYKKTHRRS